jgi:hypothetical protein
MMSILQTRVAREFGVGEARAAEIEFVGAIKTGQFEDAKRLLRKTIWERGGEDGPSQFYLKKIADLEKADQLREWTGVVRLDEK